jgi:chromosome segregation ATPase
MSQKLLEVTADNERLKEVLQQAAASSTHDDSLSRVLEMDQRDGDELLRGLGSVHAQSRAEIESTLQLSEGLNEGKRTLKDYSDYFATRFQVFKKGWTAYVQDQERTREAVGRLRESLEEIVRGVEGKAEGEQVEAVNRQRSSLETCETADFLDGFLSFSRMIQQIYVDYYENRLKEMDTSSLLASLKQQNEDFTQQISTLKQQNEDFTQQISSLKQQNEDFTRQNEDSTQQISILSSNLKKMRDQAASFRKIRQLKSIWKAETTQFIADVKTNASQTNELVAEYAQKLQKSNEHWLLISQKHEETEGNMREEKRTLEERLAAVETASAEASRQQLAQLEAERSQWDSDRSSLQAQLSALTSSSDSQIAQYLEKCNSLESDLKTAQAETIELNNQLEAAKTRSEALEESLKTSETQRKDEKEQADAELQARMPLSDVDNCLSQFFAELRAAEKTHNEGIIDVLQEGEQVCEEKADIKLIASKADLMEMMAAAVTEVKAYLNKDKSLLFSWKSAFEALEAEKTTLKSSLSDLQYQLDTSVQTHSAETSALKASIKSLNGELEVTREELENTVQQLEDKSNELQEYIEVKTSEIDTLNAAQEPLNEQMQAATDQLIAAQAMVHQLETERTAVTGERDYANQKLTEFMDKNSQLETKIENLETELADLKVRASAQGEEPAPPEASEGQQEQDRVEISPAEVSTEASTESGSQEEFKGELLKPARQKGGRKGRKK